MTVKYWISYINPEGRVSEINFEVNTLLDALMALHSLNGNVSVREIGMKQDRFLEEIIVETNVPAIPTGLTATAISDTEIVVTHNTVFNATWYEYSITDGDAFNASGTYSISSLPITISGLTAETEYTVKVRAANASGISAWSAGVADTTEAAS